MSKAKFQELDEDVKVFLTEVVLIAKETFPGREGMIKFQEALQALDGVFQEVREADGF